MNVIYSSDLIKEIETLSFKKVLKLFWEKHIWNFLNYGIRVNVSIKKTFFQTSVRVNPNIFMGIYNTYTYMVLFYKTIWTQKIIKIYLVCWTNASLSIRKKFIFTKQQHHLSIDPHLPSPVCKVLAKITSTKHVFPISTLINSSPNYF